MTKKHFQDFAVALAMISDDSERHRAATLIGGVCKQANARFDFPRFIEAVEDLRQGACPKGFTTARWLECRDALRKAAA